MKSAKIIKQELELVKKRIDKISDQMEKNNISYEDAHNHNYIWEDGTVSNCSYLELLGQFVTQKTTLEFVLRN